MLQHTAETFATDAAAYDFVPVCRRLLSDTMTPVTAFAKLDDGGPACLFESVIGGEKVGRYSFLVARPLRRFSAIKTDVTIQRFAGGQTTSVDRVQCADPIDLFRRDFGHSVAHRPGMPPFIGGAIGYASYDVVRYVEKLPHSPEDDRGLPDLDFSFYHDVCVFDHVDKTIWVICLADCRSIDSTGDANRAKALFAETQRRVQQIVDRLQSPSPVSTGGMDADPPPADALRVTSNFDQPGFEEVVRRCVGYIRAGDVFQIVPSQRLSVRCDADPLEVYRSLRVVNPSPFMFFVRTPDCTLVGCSPEIMCKVTDGVMTIRPLAGTRRRGRDEAEDRRLEEELLADPKEKAEHVMLVDLGRNDVGRVAKYGTVKLTEVMTVERYSHVMHISSEVQGTLREDCDAFDALASALPAGTVSGAPKVRAMEIIDEIEPHRRGPYGGAIGYLDYRGNMDTCIALRTMVHVDDTYYVQAGCGVVADSDPAAEYQETINKAQAMVSAISLTVARTRGDKTTRVGT